MTPFRLALAGALLMAAPAVGKPLCDDLGFAGLLAGCNRMELPPLTLSAGKPVSDGPLGLSSGVYYKLDIVADGTQELGLEGADFFRAIWVDEVVVNDIEVRPMGLHSIEFDRAGTLRLTFIAIKPGRYHLKVPGSTGDTQRVDITIQ